MKRAAVVSGALGVAVLAFWLFGAGGGRDEAPPEEANPPVRDVRVEQQDGLTVLLGTDFDAGYLSPGGDPARDLELVREIWTAAVLLVKDYRDRPLADNRDFTAFLQGNNPHRVAWIRPGHPAVNAGGELVDRWGSPLFFHRESSRATGIRSAGPDRVMWTEDDVIVEGEAEGETSGGAR